MLATTIDIKQGNENRWWYHKARIAFDVKRTNDGDSQSLRTDESIGW